MDDLTAKRLTTEMLKNLYESTFIKSLVKVSAIHQIKLQPFFGSTLPKSASGFVTFRRPTSFQED